MVVLAVLAVVVLVLTVALSADHTLDRQRVMYHDAQRMADRQDAYIKEHGGQGKPLRVPAGQTVTFRGRFSTAPGDSLRVTVNGAGYCVRVTNPAMPDARVAYDSAERPYPFNLQPGGACG